MRSACATSASVATYTAPSGTGWSGSSGCCRSTAAVHRRISWRIVGLSAAFAGSPSAPTTSWSGVARSEYANPSVTTPYTTFPAPCSPLPAPSTRTIAPIPMVVSVAVQKWNWCGVAGFCSVATTRPMGGGSRRSITIRSSGDENRDALKDSLSVAGCGLRALEVLGPVTLDDAHRSRVRGQCGGIGEHPVHDEPFVGAESREPPLREPPLERGAGFLHLESRGRQGAGRLAGVIGGDLDDPDPRSRERPAHRVRQAVEPGDGELVRVLGNRAGAAIALPEADRGGDVRPHDGRDSRVPHDPPLLDTVEKADRQGRERGRADQRAHPELRILDRVGPGELLEIDAPDARFGHVRGRHHPRREDRVDPGARHGQRVRSAQPR